MNTEITRWGQTRNTTYRWHIGAPTRNKTKYIRLPVFKKVKDKREYRKRREAQKEYEEKWVNTKVT